MTNTTCARLLARPRWCRRALACPLAPASATLRCALSASGPPAGAGGEPPAGRARGSCRARALRRPRRLAHVAARVASDVGPARHGRHVSLRYAAHRMDPRPRDACARDGAGGPAAREPVPCLRAERALLRPDRVRRAAAFAPVFLATGNPDAALNATLLGGAALTAWMLHLVLARHTGLSSPAPSARARSSAAGGSSGTLVPTNPFYACLGTVPLLVAVAARPDVRIGRPLPPRRAPVPERRRVRRGRRDSAGRDRPGPARAARRARPASARSRPCWRRRSSWPRLRRLRRRRRPQSRHRRADELARRGIDALPVARAAPDGAPLGAVPRARADDRRARGARARDARRGRVRRRRVGRVAPPRAPCRRVDRRRPRRLAHAGHRVERFGAPAAARVARGLEPDSGAARARASRDRRVDRHVAARGPGVRARDRAMAPSSAHGDRARHPGGDPLAVRERRRRATSTAAAPPSRYPIARGRHVARGWCACSATGRGRCSRCRSARWAA